jgi:hypothetical protein
MIGIGRGKEDDEYCRTYTRRLYERRNLAWGGIG